MAALRSWVGVPARRRGGRDELLLKVYVSWVAEASATLRLVRDAEAYHATRLELYLARLHNARLRGVDRLDTNEPAFTAYATLRRGVGFERGRLAWCRWLIGHLEGATSKPPVTG